MQEVQCFRVMQGSGDLNLGPSSSSRSLVGPVVPVCSGIAVVLGSARTYAAGVSVLHCTARVSTLTECVGD